MYSIIQTAKDFGVDVEWIFPDVRNISIRGL